MLSRATLGVAPHRATNEASIITIGFWSSVAGTITWSGMGVESILRPIQDNRREMFWPLPFVCTVVAFACIHLLQRNRSRLERVGWFAITVGSALMLLGNIGLQLNIRSLGFLDAPLGPMIFLFALLLFGVGIFAAGVLPKIAGWAVILLEPMSIGAAFMLLPIAPMFPRGAYSGNIGKGIALGMIAFAFRAFSSRERSAFE